VPIPMLPTKMIPRTNGKSRIVRPKQVVRKAQMPTKDIYSRTRDSGPTFGVNEPLKRKPATRGGAGKLIDRPIERTGVTADSGLFERAT
jgi:hypothetical protein